MVRSTVRVQLADELRKRIADRCRVNIARCRFAAAVADFRSNSPKSGCLGRRNTYSPFSTRRTASGFFGNAYFLARFSKYFGEWIFEKQTFIASGSSDIITHFFYFTGFPADCQAFSPKRGASCTFMPRIFSAMTSSASRCIRKICTPSAERRFSSGRIASIYR